METKQELQTRLTEVSEMSNKICEMLNGKTVKFFNEVLKNVETKIKESPIVVDIEQSLKKDLESISKANF